MKYVVDFSSTDTLESLVAILIALVVIPIRLLLAYHIGRIASPIEQVCWNFVKLTPKCLLSSRTCLIKRPPSELIFYEQILSPIVLVVSPIRLIASRIELNILLKSGEVTFPTGLVFPIALVAFAIGMVGSSIECN